eukprot:11163391-Lingulodinium_polyedra.AAC.1
MRLAAARAACQEARPEASGLRGRASGAPTCVVDVGSHGCCKLFCHVSRLAQVLHDEVQKVPLGIGKMPRL